MDVIITAAFGYQSGVLVPFMHSLRKVYNGRLVLVISSSQLEEMSELINFYKIEPLLIERNNRIAPHSERYFIYRNFLESNKDIKRCFLTDSRDVIFQSSPFTNERPHLYLYAEPAKFSQCPWNGPVVARYYGNEFLSQISEKTILCSGTTIGSYELINLYVNRMCDELARLIAHQSVDGQVWEDQAMHNFLYYSGQFPGAEIRSHGYSEVQTLNYEKTFSFDTDCFLLNRDGSRVPVVHQYDRFPQFASNFEKMLNSGVKD